MKRLVYMMMALVVLFAANSCKDKKTSQVITPTDSLDLEEVADDSTIYGVCGEGTSMHNLELISDEGDTLSVFIDDEQPDIVQGGLLAGDRIALIGYKAQDGEMMAQKIINLTSLLGKWTSLDKNFNLLEGGEVKNNVKAETNPWTSWKILNGKLLLNKDTFAIDKSLAPNASKNPHIEPTKKHTILSKPKSPPIIRGDNPPTATLPNISFAIS
jgi:hypothetical protein